MSLVIKTELFDSTIWNAIKPRKTDIIIATCAKSGTTLTQQIVNLIINGHSDFKYLYDLSPWVEEKPEIFFGSLEDKLNHIENLPAPRFFKSHLPFDALPYYPEWKYISIVRDGRDIGLSLYNHFKAQDPKYYKDFGNQFAGSFSEFWEKWVKNEEFPGWIFGTFVKNNWWKARHLPNVLLVHYSNLINDKPNEIPRIANFLNIEIDSAKMKTILHESSFEYMSTNWEKFQPPGFLPGAFFGKGKNGRWQDLLTQEQIEEYETMICEQLGSELANWLKSGGSLTSSN